MVFFLNGMELELPGSVVEDRRQRTSPLVQAQAMRLFNGVEIFTLNKNRGKNKGGLVLIG